MLTECPHCLTVLKVSAEIIYAGDSRVRCGECLRVFSAREHLTANNTELETTRIYHPPKQRQLATTEEPQFSLRPEVAKGLRALVDKPRRAAQPPAPKPRRAASKPALERGRRAAIPSRPAASPPAAKTPPPPAKTPPPSKAPATAAAATPKPASAHAAPKPAEHRHVSVLAQQSSRAGRSAPLRSRSLVTVLLLLALSLLALDAIRSVANTPELQAELRRLWCGVVDCASDNTASRDFSQLQIIRRKIYAHPNADGVLVISLAMVNRHAQPLAYPTLQVRMTDRGGEVIARGRFAPRDYVNNYDTTMSIASERVVDVVLKVADPGDAAQSFDLEFQ